jgi:opacity protein-like surface antigen
MNRYAVLMTFLLVPALSSAQSFGNKWEWSIAGIYQESESSGGDGGSGVEIDSEIGFGFTLKYFFNPKLAVGGDIEWIRPDYTATLVDDQGMTQTFSHTFTQFNGRLKATYDFTENNFSPFVEAGIGWTQFDSNVADGPPLVGCWWHPWWGYICSGFYDTITETNFSYGGALGLRYRLRGGSVVKLSYNTYQLDGSSAEVDPSISAFRLEFAWGF